MSAAVRPTRSSWLAFAGLAQVVGVALLPKCPLCLAMDFGIAGSLVAAFQSRFGPILWPSLGLAAASGVALFLRYRSRPAARRVRPCCAP